MAVAAVSTRSTLFKPMMALTPLASAQTSQRLSNRQSGKGSGATIHATAMIAATSFLLERVGAVEQRAALANAFDHAFVVIGSRDDT